MDRMPVETSYELLIMVMAIIITLQQIYIGDLKNDKRSKH